MPRVATRRERSALPLLCLCCSRASAVCIRVSNEIFLVPREAGGLMSILILKINASDWLRSLPTSPRKCTLSKLLRITLLPEPLRTHMVALLLASSNVVGMLVSPSAPMARDAGHAARRTTQLQMVRPSSDEPATLPVA